MVLGIEYSNRYYNVKVDSGNAIAPENTNPGKVALIDPTESNSDLTITTYDLGELTEGEHTISVISAANNSRDFFAMGFVKYTPAPATETPAPTEEPATATLNRVQQQNLQKHQQQKLRHHQQQLCRLMTISKLILMMLTIS